MFSVFFHSFQVCTLFALLMMDKLSSPTCSSFMSSVVADIKRRGRQKNSKIVCDRQEDEEGEDDFANDVADEANEDEDEEEDESEEGGSENKATTSRKRCVPDMKISKSLVSQPLSSLGETTESSSWYTFIQKIPKNCVGSWIDVASRYGKPQTYFLQEYLEPVEEDAAPVVSEEGCTQPKRKKGGENEQMSPRKNDDTLGKRRNC